METFTLIFEDEDQNELFTMPIFAFDLQEAEKIADIELATTRINDLFKVIVKK